MNTYGNVQIPKAGLTASAGLSVSKLSIAGTLVVESGGATMAGGLTVTTGGLGFPGGTLSVTQSTVSAVVASVAGYSTTATQLIQGRLIAGTTANANAFMVMYQNGPVMKVLSLFYHKSGSCIFYLLFHDGRSLGAVKPQLLTHLLLATLS